MPERSLQSRYKARNVIATCLVKANCGASFERKFISVIRTAARVIPSSVPLTSRAWFQARSRSLSVAVHSPFVEKATVSSGTGGVFDGRPSVFTEIPIRHPFQSTFGSASPDDFRTMSRIHSFAAGVSSDCEAIMPTTTPTSASPSASNILGRPGTKNFRSRSQERPSRNAGSYFLSS